MMENLKLRNLHSLKSQDSVADMSNMKEACSSLRSKLEQLSKEQSECTIYRVHRHLKNVNPSAYEPEVIAIGPYHRGKKHLKMMENHKLRNLHSLLKRLGFLHLNTDTYATAISGVESLKARKCYADLQDVSLTDSEFIEMLVLDGCFIIELVRKFADGSLGEKDDDPIFKMDWMISSLQRDLMLFENQVPFFVLRELFAMIDPDEDCSVLIHRLTNFFSGLYPGKGHSGKLLQDGDHEIKHLLDLIHRNWVPPRPDQQSSPQKEDEKNKNPAPLMMPVQERKEKEVVMGSMPVQKMKETEVDMVGSTMSIEETEETEVDMVGSSMPIEDRKDASREVATTDSVPGQERKETEVMVDMFLDEIDVEMGSGGVDSMPLRDMPLQEAKGKKGGGGMPLRDMPAQERKEKEVVLCSMPVQERKEKEIVMLGGMPLLDMMHVRREVVQCSMPVQKRKQKFKMDMFFNKTEVAMGSGMPVQERKEKEVVTTDSGGQESKEVTIPFINCATKLTEANVEFKMEDKDTLFHIDFKDGVMEMPPLRIEDMTECFLRNLIVYEQYFRPHTVVTDYMKLLDSLINSDKDVEILSRNKIIKNWQGDDAVVATMVNRLGDMVACGGSNFSYAKLFEEVNKHCERRWNRWMAKLRRDYLNSPWAIISIIAAVVLLLLTVTQTLLSIFQVVQQS